MGPDNYESVKAVVVPSDDGKRAHALLTALGLDPEQIEYGSFQIRLVGGGFEVRWAGYRFVTREEMDLAMKAFNDAV
jgi:hypothetical protein